jgi:hypothetical protein
MLTLAPHALGGRTHEPLAEQALGFQVLGLHMERLRVQMEGPAQMAVGAAHVLELGVGVGPLQAEIVGVDASAPGPIVTFELRDVSLDTARALLTLMAHLESRRLAVVAPDDDRAAEGETITEPRRIREIVRGLFANHCSARALDAEGQVHRVLVPLGIVPDAEAPLEWRVAAAGNAADEAFAPATIEVNGFLSLFRLTFSASTTHGSVLATTVPTSIERVRRRAFIRNALPEGTAFITFSHPRYPDLVVRRPLHDVTFDGVSFGTERADDALYPGLCIPELTIEWRGPEHERFTFRGTITHTDPFFDSAMVRGGFVGEELAGIQLSPVSEDEKRRWHRRIHAVECPSARTDGIWSEELWRLYDRAGYFSLSGKSTPDFAPLKDAFAEAGRRIAAAPQLGSQVVVPWADGAEGSITILKTYDRSAFIYQLARRPADAATWAERRKVLRDVHLAIVSRTMRDLSHADWLIAWVQDSARFSRLVYHDVPARHVETGRASISFFRAMECKVSAALGFAPEAIGDVRTGSASASERAALVDHLGRTRDRAFLEAHDLVPERFDLAGIAGEWKKASLHRERDVLMAYDKGGSRTAAVVEMADDGLHLFGLMDVLRLFPLDGQPVSRETTWALLAAAREWYAARGKRTFCYFLEGDDVKPASDAGLIDLGGAFLTALRTELLPDLLEQVYHVTAPRDVPFLTGASGYPARSEP